MKARLAMGALAAVILVSFGGTAATASAATRYHGTATFALPQGVLPN